MRENKILENVTVLNKVDNRQYLITSVTDGVGTACLLENGEVNEDISVMISSSNAIAFRLISNPNIPDINTKNVGDKASLIGCLIRFRDDLAENTEVGKQCKKKYDEMIAAGTL